MYQSHRSVRDLHASFNCNSLELDLPSLFCLQLFNDFTVVWKIFRHRLWKFWYSIDGRSNEIDRIYVIGVFFCLITNLYRWGSTHRNHIHSRNHGNSRSHSNSPSCYSNIPSAIVRTDSTGADICWSLQKCPGWSELRQ